MHQVLAERELRASSDSASSGARSSRVDRARANGGSLGGSGSTARVSHPTGRPAHSRPPRSTTASRPHQSKEAVKNVLLCVSTPRPGRRSAGPPQEGGDPVQLAATAQLIKHGLPTAGFWRISGVVPRGRPALRSPSARVSTPRPLDVTADVREWQRDRWRRGCCFGACNILALASPGASSRPWSTRRVGEPVPRKARQLAPRRKIPVGRRKGVPPEVRFVVDALDRLRIASCERGDGRGRCRRRGLLLRSDM